MSCTQNFNYSYGKDDQYNQPPRSTQQKLTHQSFQEHVNCVICTAVKGDAHVKVVPVQTTTFQETDSSLYLVEKQPKEFMQIHVENCTKFQDDVEQILVNWATTVTLFATNTGYHKSCCQVFRGPLWKKTCYCFERNYIGELLDVIDCLVVLKKEGCTLMEPRELYTNIKGVAVD